MCSIFFRIQPIGINRLSRGIRHNSLLFYFYISSTFVRLYHITQRSIQSHVHVSLNRLLLLRKNKKKPFSIFLHKASLLLKPFYVKKISMAQPILHHQMFFRVKRFDKFHIQQQILVAAEFFKLHSNKTKAIPK